MENRTEILEKVKSSISEKVGVDVEQINENSNLSTDLSVDSLDKVELMMDAEKEFNITIPDDEAENLETVGKFVDLIEKKINE